jgi:hypothetical protein
MNLGGVSETVFVDIEDEDLMAAGCEVTGESPSDT